MKIKLIDDTLNPYDYLCHHIVPEKSIWERGGDNPDAVVGIAKNGIMQAMNYPGDVIKCAWVIEPSVINGEDYRLVVENQDKFDYIFLHDLSFKDKINPEKFVYLVHGGTHLRNQDIQLHDKTKLVSFIFSNKNWNRYHGMRHEIYPKIKDRVESFGTGCGNFIQYKAQGLNDFCFSIAMENYDSLGLFTEKIVDCFLSGTIPIFYGTPDIGNYFNTKGMFTFKDIDELNNILDGLSFEKYNEMKPYLLENFVTSKKYIFPEQIISDVINKHVK